MRISPIGLQVFHNRNQVKNNFQKTYLNQPCFDKVSFTGVKKEKEELSPKNVGINIGKSMLKLAENGELNKESISSLMNANSEKEIEIYKIDENPNLPNLPGHIVAYMQPYYDENFNFLSAELYLQDYDDIKTLEEQCDFIANSAHEFAHILQRSKNKDMNGFLNYSKDMDKFQVISNLGFQVLGEILNLQMSKTLQNPDKIEKVSKDVENGKLDFSPYAIDIQPVVQVLRIGASVAAQQGYDVAETQKELLEWMYNTARDEQEAYEVTLAVYDECGQIDKDTKTRRALVQGIYKYVADELEPIVNKIKQN